MPSDDTLFPQSGDNFKTVAFAGSDQALAELILDLSARGVDDPNYTQEELERDYAVVMEEFQRRLECTGTPETR